MSPSRRSSDSFLDFVVGQLDGAGELDCRPMFGGYGLYLEGTFFGIVFDGCLYFRTDEESRERYLARGMAPFQPNARQTLRRYYQVPVDILEDADSLQAWAWEAVRSRT